jgi:uncharacterized OB-fold protein
MADKKPQLFSIEGESVTLFGTECARCHHRWFPPLLFGCEKCGAYGEDLLPCDLSGNGQILSFTTVPDADGGTYTLAQLALDDGPAIRAIIDEPGPEELSIGDSVEAVGVKEGDELNISFRKQAHS